MDSNYTTLMQFKDDAYLVLYNDDLWIINHEDVDDFEVCLTDTIERVNELTYYLDNYLLGRLRYARRNGAQAQGTSQEEGSKES